MYICTKGKRMETGNNIVDLSFIIKFTKGDSDKIKYFIEMYIRTTAQLFGEMEDKFDEMSNDELFSRAHSLKPQSAYVGIIGLQETLIEIENATRENKDRGAIKELVQKAIELNNRGITELGTLIESAKVV